VDADTSLASALDDIDDRLDELQVAYVQAIFRSHSEMNLNLQGAVQMAMIGRYYERVGDHAVNIGERVMYMVTGWLPEKSGAARQRLREAEAEADVQSSDSSNDAEGTAPAVESDLSSDDSLGEFPDRP
jgi:phosphate transport system protein